MNDQPAGDQQQPNSYVDDYVPPTTNSTQVDEPATMPVNTDEPGADQDFDQDSDQDLEAQNVFFMLGVSDGSEELKEKFLDQLQEVIWEDFLTNDSELLLTQEELVEFKELVAKKDAATGEEARERAQDVLIEYLEKLIPDLEDIMLEKALDLKADLFVERIASMKQYFAENQEKLDITSQAESLMFDDKWKSAAELLNSIQE